MSSGGAIAYVENDPVTAHYLTFVRKETRLRADQMDVLAAKARQINRHKKDRGERIPDNTLIRTAVGLSLARADRLAGSTEDELRNSVSLQVLDCASRLASFRSDRLSIAQ